MSRNKRPLVIAVDTAGGEEPSRIARRLTDALARSGVNPERIAIWPNTDQLNLWSMSAEDLRAVLEGLLDPSSVTRGGDR
ncbi:hypothetical protein [Nocardia sp. NPDC127526]|uniref:hypothetical protein n=1 Tax=Nocardia sp. NPDC127526 TaxID=3345393 RepID=UPI003643FAEE